VDVGLWLGEPACHSGFRWAAHLRCFLEGTGTAEEREKGQFIHEGQVRGGEMGGAAGLLGLFPAIRARERVEEFESKGFRVALSGWFEGEASVHIPVGQGLPACLPPRPPVQQQNIAF
jgi:hypothetical protein